MNNLFRIRKQLSLLLSLLLAIAILGEVSIKTSAFSQNTLVYVYTYASVDSNGFWLSLLKCNEIAYITASDAAKLSGMDEFIESDNGVEFNTGYHKVFFSGKAEAYNGVKYYELQGIMDALSTQYKYIPEDETLYFVACEYFYEDLLHDCNMVFAGGYQVAYIDNFWGYGVAAIYNIMSGLRFDAIWGGYQQEQYEIALAGMMQVDETVSSLVEMSILGDTIMSDLSDIYSLDEYIEIFGYPYDDYIEAYNVLNEAVPFFEIEDFLDIMKSIYASQNAYELYVEAVKYGLVENAFVKDSKLKRAVNSVYSYYDNSRPLYIDAIFDAGNTALSNATAEVLKEYALKRIIGINTAYISATKVFFDNIGMRNMTKATEQTHACSVIQTTIKMNYDSLDLYSYSNLNTSEKRGWLAKNVKYNTLLYLRACQYAFSLYSFDKELREASEFWIEKTQTAIEKIALYSDADLSRIVVNDQLNLSENGFRNEITKLPDMTQFIGKWGSGRINDDVCEKTLTINRVQDNQIDFNIEYYRLYAYYDQVATINPDGTAFFNAFDGFNNITGTFMFSENCISMTIEESTMEYIGEETIVFSKLDYIPIVEIQVEWDGISNNDLVKMELSITGTLDTGQTIWVTNDSPQAYDSYNNLIIDVNENITKEKGEIIVAIYNIYGVYNMQLSAHDPEIIMVNEIANSNVSVYVNYPQQSSGHYFHIDDYKETRLNRSYAGVWYWDVFDIDHGSIIIGTSTLENVANYLGVDIDSVVKEFGPGYVDDYYKGGRGYFYDGIKAGFIFNEGGNEKVYFIVAWGDINYGYGLSGKMTYGEIVETLSSYLQIEEPSFIYNLHDECYEYTLNFNINGNQVDFTWSNDPYVNKSEILYISNWDLYGQ